MEFFFIVSETRNEKNDRCRSDIHIRVENRASKKRQAAAGPDKGKYFARAESHKNKNPEKLPGQNPTRAKNRNICPRKIRQRQKNMKICPEQIWADTDIYFFLLKNNRL